MTYKPTSTPRAIRQVDHHDLQWFRFNPDKDYRFRQATPAECGPDRADKLGILFSLCAKIDIPNSVTSAMRNIATPSQTGLMTIEVEFPNGAPNWALKQNQRKLRKLLIEQAKKDGIPLVGIRR